jgi:CBS domain-containing protein
MSVERIPPLKSVMTPFPHSIEADHPLAEARRMMAEEGFRHLPVTRDHVPVGVLSDRDVRRLLESRIGLSGDDDLLVSDAMTPDPYMVDLDTPLDHALTVMAEDHIGCTIVTRSGRLAGIVTSSDVCRAFAEHLGRLRPHGDEIA